jgi:hypothetical protein
LYRMFECACYFLLVAGEAPVADPKARPTKVATW